MTLEEFSDQFDLLYNNITSNQAPGLTEYEKSVFLTKAQDEIVKNYFSANSKGNNLQQGFDDSAKRQADFSVIMKTAEGAAAVYDPGDASTAPSYIYTYTIDSTQYTIKLGLNQKFDRRSLIFGFPDDVFIPVGEDLIDTIKNKEYQIIPLRFDEYTRLMSKSFKRPLKNQAWRLINSGTVNNSTNAYIKLVEIVTSPDYSATNSTGLSYRLRYVRRPAPIILGNLDGLKINGKEYNSSSPVECELDPILHEDILQRAVELAKVAWTQTGQDNIQAVLQAGQRSE